MYIIFLVRSLQQALSVLSTTDIPPHISSSAVSDLSNATIFNTLGASGGNLLHGGHRNVQIRTEFQNESCLLIWLSDHFKDGWDRAVLTVRAPDLTNDTFHPHCDQVGWIFVFQLRPLQFFCYVLFFFFFCVFFSHIGGPFLCALLSISAAGRGRLYYQGVCPNPGPFLLGDLLESARGGHG